MIDTAVIFQGYIGIRYCGQRYCGKGIVDNRTNKGIVGNYPNKDICGKNYSEVNFLPSKLKKMTDGTLMKYMSGGEYEHQSLRLFVDFQCFLKKYIFWDCNVTVFDEPGTAMSTNALQQFVDGLERDRCNLVITHKPIKCSIEVHLP